MEINEKRVTEIFLATILVLLLIVIIFLFTSQSTTGKSLSTISNSYNTYYINQDSQTQEYYKPYDSIYSLESDLDQKRYLQFKSRSDLIREDRLFGEDIQKYIVYVRNKEYKGGYFTVKFYFEDYYGKETTQSITHYIKPYEEKAFYYKDLYADRYEHYKTYYKVIPITKSS